MSTWVVSQSKTPAVSDRSPVVFVYCSVMAILLLILVIGMCAAFRLGMDDYNYDKATHAMFTAHQPWYQSDAEWKQELATDNSEWFQNRIADIALMASIGVGAAISLVMMLVCICGALTHWPQRK